MYKYFDVSVVQGIFVASMFTYLLITCVYNVHLLPTIQLLFMNGKVYYKYYTSTIPFPTLILLE